MHFKNLTLDAKLPVVMGILNVTPDSFSDGGMHNQSIEQSVNTALKMAEQGASIIDIGGESTRPGAPDVSLDEELSRVIPVVEAIRQASDIVISVDTSKSEVMEEALVAGADMINDVRALQNTGCKDVVAKYQVPVCLMHMQGQPRSMQKKPHYNDLFADIFAFFEVQIAQCIEAGILRENILLDPGFGFGKTLEHNYLLLDGLDKFHQFGLPLLVGMSRKSMIGNVLNKDTSGRLSGSLAAATIAAMKGAHILRVHDVEATKDAINIVSYLNQIKV